LPFLILRSKQGQYAVEDFAGATAIIYHPVQIGRRFIDIGWHPYKKSASCASVNDNCHQRLSHLASNRSHNRLNIY
jgi:hypothetical protein